MYLQIEGLRQGAKHEMLENIELQRAPLSNGAVAIANPNNSTRSIAFVGSIKAGAMHDERGKFGTAELVARLLNHGTLDFSLTELPKQIEEIGATLQFSNYDESVSFSGRCHSESIVKVLEILASCLSRPTFSPEELEKVRAEVLADLEAERDETRTAAYRGLLSLVYGRTMAYGRNSLGTIEDVLEVTREDAIAFHERFYQPESLILSLTGSIESLWDAKFFSNVNETIGAWESKSRGNNQDDHPMSETSEPSSTRIPMPHKSQVDLALGAKAVPRGSNEYYSLSLGNLILGRIGLYGRLGKNVREEKGLAYYCYSTLQSKYFSGHIGIFAGVNPKNVQGAIDGIAEEVRRISSEPLSQEEMLRARRNLKGSLSIALESSFERASIIHDIEYYELGLDYLSKYPALLDQVSSENILTSFEKYFTLEKIRLAAAGPVTSESSLSLTDKPPTGESPKGIS